MVAQAAYELCTTVEVSVVVVETVVVTWVVAWAVTVVVVENENVVETGDALDINVSIHTINPFRIVG